MSHGWLLDGILGGLIEPELGRRLGKLRYLIAFLIGFLGFPIALLIYMPIRLGWHAIPELIIRFANASSTDQFALLAFCTGFGMLSVFLAFINRPYGQDSDQPRTQVPRAADGWS
jgi:hypothetical protein